MFPCMLGAFELALLSPSHPRLHRGGGGVTAALVVAFLVILDLGVGSPGLLLVVAPLVWPGPVTGLSGPWLSNPGFVGKATQCDRVSIEPPGGGTRLEIMEIIVDRWINRPGCGGA